MATVAKDRRASITVYVVGEKVNEFVREIVQDIRGAAEDLTVDITTLNTMYSAEIEKDKKQVRTEDRTPTKES